MEEQRNEQHWRKKEEKNMQEKIIHFNFFPWQLTQAALASPVLLLRRVAQGIFNETQASQMPSPAAQALITDLGMTSGGEMILETWMFEEQERWSQKWTKRASVKHWIDKGLLKTELTGIFNKNFEQRWSLKASPKKAWWRLRRFWRLKTWKLNFMNFWIDIDKAKRRQKDKTKSAERSSINRRFWWKYSLEERSWIEEVVDVLKNDTSKQEFDTWKQQDKSLKVETSQQSEIRVKIWKEEEKLTWKPLGKCGKWEFWRQEVVWKCWVNFDFGGPDEAEGGEIWQIRLQIWILHPK